MTRNLFNRQPENARKYDRGLRQKLSYPCSAAISVETVFVLELVTNRSRLT